MSRTQVFLCTIASTSRLMRLWDKYVATDIVSVPFVKQNQNLLHECGFIFCLRGLFWFVVHGGEIAIVAPGPPNHVSGDPGDEHRRPPCRRAVAGTPDGHRSHHSHGVLRV